MSPLAPCPNCGAGIAAPFKKRSPLIPVAALAVILAVAGLTVGMLIRNGSLDLAALEMTQESGPRAQEIAPPSP